MTERMYQVEVPQGVFPGQQFQAMLDGQHMLVTCPEGVGPGSKVQVAAPSIAPPTVTGVPVVGGVGVGPGPEVGGVRFVHVQPQIEMVEVEEISPAGWFCLIVGCFACPGLNLLGLCMRERRLVPVAHYHNLP